MDFKMYRSAREDMKLDGKIRQEIVKSCLG